jgi:hypothetical protein
MPTTGKNNDRKDRRNSALNIRRNYKKYKKKLGERTFTLLKTKTLPFHKRHKKATKVRKFQMNRQTKT